MIPDGVVEWLCLRAFVSAAKLADGDTAHRRGSAGLNMRHSQSKKVTCFLEMRAYRTILLVRGFSSVDFLMFSEKSVKTLKSIFGYFRIWRVCVWHPCPKKNSPHGLNLSSAASCWMLHGGVVVLRSVGALIAGAPLAVSRAFRTEVQAAGERAVVYRGVIMLDEILYHLGWLKHSSSWNMQYNHCSRIVIPQNVQHNIW